MSKDLFHLPYRACVGIMLLNADGRIWSGRRVHDLAGEATARLWQMPQGGIDKGELPERAAWRELLEETGASNAKILGQTDDWLYYDLPSDILGTALNGKYCGQKQIWFAMRFLGSDDEFNINPVEHEPEFDEWRWSTVEQVLEEVVDFKRPVYEQVFEIFGHLLR